MGVPILVAGLVYMVGIGWFLLPNRKSAVNEYLNHPRQYTITAVVEDSQGVAEKTIEQAKLNQLDGLFLIDMQVRNSFEICLR